MQFRFTSAYGAGKPLLRELGRNSSATLGRLPLDWVDSIKTTGLHELRQDMLR